MRLIVILLLLAACFLGACSGGKKLKSYHSTKFFDEYFVLKKKRYTRYMQFLVHLPRHYGTYVQSNDTVYLLYKIRHKRRTYGLAGTAILDTANRSVRIRWEDRLENEKDEEEMHIIYDTRKR